MRKEHREADDDHEAWLEDIEGWRTEHRRASEMLARAQTALLDGEAALEAHAETVRALRSYVRRHEWAMADHERVGSEVEHDELAESQQDPQAGDEVEHDELTGAHEDFSAKHEQARAAHQRIKEHHSTVTAEITRLLEELTAPM
jgi:hypothetical protein